MSLTTAQLSAMRATANVYMTDTCTTQRAVVTQDDMGGVVNTFATLGSNVPCRMDEPKTSGPEAAINLEVGASVRRILHFKYDADITAKDRVVYGGVTYEVSEVLEAATWLISRRVVVARIE